MLIPRLARGSPGVVGVTVDADRRGVAVVADDDLMLPPEGDDPTLFDQLAPFDPLLRKAFTDPQYAEVMS